MKNSQYRERTCNFCDFSEYCRIPDGIACNEEHHQEGKDQFQYYGHSACEYFKDENGNDVYGLVESRRKWHEDELNAKRAQVKRLYDEIAEKQEEIEALVEEIKNG